MPYAKNEMKIENEELNQKWIEYNKERLSGSKKSANHLLDIFIKSICAYEKDVIEDFVYEICSIVLKDNILFNNGTDVSNAKIRIQHPLFQRVILPILTKKYKENDALYIRWLGQFEQFFYSDNRMTNMFLEEINDELRDAVQFSSETNKYENIKCRYFSTKYFLIKSFEIEPNQITLKLILDTLAKHIDYVTHELPFGLLEDAEIFIQRINEFKYYCKKFDDKNKWEKRIEEWSWASNHWKVFSKEKDKHKNFEEYLNKAQ